MRQMNLLLGAQGDWTEPLARLSHAAPVPQLVGHSYEKTPPGIQQGSALFNDHAGLMDMLKDVKEGDVVETIRKGEVAEFAANQCHSVELPCPQYRLAGYFGTRTFGKFA